MLGKSVGVKNVSHIIHYSLFKESWILIAEQIVQVYKIVGS